MPSRPIKSCNKYVLSYKDSSNNTHQIKKARDLDNAKDFPTIADLMREQKVSNNDDTGTVHHRRDLDSLG